MKRFCCPVPYFSTNPLQQAWVPYSIQVYRIDVQVYYNCNDYFLSNLYSIQYSLYIKTLKFLVEITKIINGGGTIFKWHKPIVYVWINIVVTLTKVLRHFIRRKRKLPIRGGQPCSVVRILYVLIEIYIR